MQEPRTLQTGSGSPEGSVTAVAGTCFLDATSGVLYHKAKGMSTTGWVAISLGGGDPSPIQTATMTVTAAQIKHWAATPIQVVAAPGLNKVILPISTFGQYTFGTAAYVDGGNNAGAGFFYQGTSPLVGASGGYYNLVSSGVSDMLSPAPTSIGLAGASFDNKALMFGAGNPGDTEWTVGDGTLTVTVLYTVVTLS